jgi:hypothetical protein
VGGGWSADLLNICCSFFLSPLSPLWAFDLQCHALRNREAWSGMEPCFSKQHHFHLQQENVEKCRIRIDLMILNCIYEDPA